MGVQMSNISKYSSREIYGRTLLEMGRINEKVIACDADMSNGTSEYLAKEFPLRQVEVGIAEQNLMNVAIGIATTGKLVYANTYSAFASMRACEQVRTFACYPNINLRVIAGHGGLTPGTDGPTHQTTEDMGIMRTIPNMCVIMPADNSATRALLFKTMDWKGPLFFRLVKGFLPDVYDENETFEIGKGKIVREGADVSIIANGDMLYYSLQAAEKLAGQGIQARVVDMHTIKPLDKELVLDCCAKTGAVVTVEDHSIYNGLGSAVAEIIAEERPTPFKRIGVKDTFAESGEFEELLVKYGLSTDDIVRAACEVAGKKQCTMDN
jgi:transketolase